MREEPRTTAADAFARLVEIVAILRSEDGCPWDRQQTHESLLPSTVEEAFEFVEAVEAGSSMEAQEELGDILILAALHAQIAADAESFTMLDVLNAANQKLIRRHPHVFGDVEVDSTDQVLANWEAIKRAEPGKESRRSALDGVPTGLPALMAAYKLQRKAARVGFDWERPEEVLDKVREEVGEVEAHLNSEHPDGHAALEDEIGDLLFAVVNLARALDIEPEAALRRANRKFVRRFQRMEELLSEQGDAIGKQTLAELDRLWDRAKSEESKDGSPSSRRPNVG